MPTEIKMHKPHKPLLINIDFKFYLKKQPAKKQKMKDTEQLINKKNNKQEGRIM